MRPMAHGLDTDQADIDTQRERSKWYLWHGNVLRALQVLDGLLMALENLEGTTERVMK
jgi:hypothetical protein